MYQLVFYVPQEQCEAVKSALFAKGAGRYANYDSCSWQVLGTGQFRPLAGSKPFLGSRGKVEHVSEYRVEMVCAEEVLDEVLEELLRVHPYEEPAYGVYKIQTILDR